VPQLLTLSRAARLVGATRGELQKRIRDNELETFEGNVKVSDLLRAFPEARLEDDSSLERVRRIKAAAAPRRDQEPGLPPPEVLATRLTGLSRELTEAKAELGNYSALVTELSDKLAALQELDDASLREGARGLAAWFVTQMRERPKVPKRKAELLAKDTFLRMLAAQVKIIPSGHEFFVEGTDSILEAALRSGLALRYGCTSGTCGSCKARVVSGEVLKVRDHDYEIGDTEHNLGFILMCSYTAVTDLTLEAAEAHSGADIPEQEIEARVKQLTRPNDELAILNLQTPKTQRLRFLAGQDVSLCLEEGVAADLPIASCPCDGQNLEFHVHRQPSSAFVEAVFQGGVIPDQPITVTGPHGDFVLRDDASNPLLFLVYGAGFAPVKSLIESAISIDNAESYHLYWAAPKSSGHYMDNRCRSWTDALDNFHYTRLVLSLNGDELRVAELLQARIPELGDIARYEVYAAGPEVFLRAVRTLLFRQGLAAEQTHFEATH
jgi:CDP-4-dehydro-6-deoxyglucose reductase